MSPDDSVFRLERFVDTSQMLKESKEEDKLVQVMVIIVRVVV